MYSRLRRSEVRPMSTIDERIAALRLQGWTTSIPQCLELLRSEADAKNADAKIALTKKTPEIVRAVLISDPDFEGLSLKDKDYIRHSIPGQYFVAICAQLN